MYTVKDGKALSRVVHCTKFAGNRCVTVQYRNPDVHVSVTHLYVLPCRGGGGKRSACSALSEQWLKQTMLVRVLPLLPYSSVWLRKQQLAQQVEWWLQRATRCSWLWVEWDCFSQCRHLDHSWENRSLQVLIWNALESLIVLLSGVELMKLPSVAADGMYVKKGNQMHWMICCWPHAR